MEGITYANFVRSPMSGTDIVDITVGVIMRCGLLTEPYIKCHERADIARTWIDFQPFWQEQLKLRKNTMVAAGQMCYGMNAAKWAKEINSKITWIALAGRI